MGSNFKFDRSIICNQFTAILPIFVIENIDFGEDDDFIQLSTLYEKSFFYFQEIYYKNYLKNVEGKIITLDQLKNEINFEFFKSILPYSLFF